MTSPGPTESLESIAFLVQATSPPHPSTHLLALVHQRSHSLVQLQASVRTLAAQREQLTSHVGAYANAVEAAVAAGPADRSGVRRAAEARAQDAFIKAHTDAVQDCEASWTAASREIDRWELSAPSVQSGSTARAGDPSAYAPPRSWATTQLDTDSEAAIHELLVLLLSDPRTLGAGIATLDLPTDLSSPSFHGRSSTPPPLETLLRLLAAASGPDAVLALALGAWESSIREIVGREQSRSQGNGERKSSGAGSGGAREKELEAFLVAMLDALDALGLEVEVAPTANVAPAAGQQSSTSAGVGSTGPLSLHRGTEDVFLKLLHDARALQPPSQTPPVGLHSTPPSQTGSTFSSNSWGSTVTSSVTSGVSSTFSHLNAGFYSVATLGSSITSAGLNYLPSPPGYGGAPTSPPEPASTPLTSRSKSAPSSATSSPSKPSRIDSGPAPWTHRSFLITRTVTSLLHLFTPPPPTTSRRVPLVEALLSQLLQTSFPLSSSEGAGHRKVLLLGVVRWWAFSWLGKKIGRAASGGAYTSSAIPFGVHLSTDPDDARPLPEASVKPATALLDEVYVSGRDSLDLMLAIHKSLYSALVNAAGFGGDEWGARPEEGEREKRALAAAAKGLVRSWGGRTPEAGIKTQRSSGDDPATSVRPGLAAFVLSSNDVVALWSSFSPLVLRSPAAGPSMTPGGTFTSAPPPSFKRAFSTTSSASTDTEIATVRKGVFALLRTGRLYPRAASAAPPIDVFRPLPPPEPRAQGQSIVEAFDAAIQRAAVEHDWLNHSSFSQALSILKRHLRTSPDLTTLLIPIAYPLRSLFNRSDRTFRLARLHLDEIESQRRRLLDLARAERGAIDDLRIRAFYSSIKGSSLGDQLRARLADVKWTRTKEEKDAATRKVRDWAAELGVFSFTKAESGFEESLMLVEVASVVALQPSSFYSSPFWAREERVMGNLIIRSQQRTRPSFAESLFASGTSILTAPLTLAGLPFPSNSTPAPPSPTSSSTPQFILSFGCASESFLRPNEHASSSVNALEEHLTRVGLKTSGFLMSDVGASTITNVDSDGRLLGCDAWIEEFASPLSPLPRPSSADVRAGASPLPKAFNSTTPARSHPAFRNLLNRFINHPSPHAKVLALFELELVLASTMSASTATSSSSPAIPTSPLSEPALSPRVGGKKYLARLSALLSNRKSLAPSAIAMLLEAEEDVDDEFRGHAQEDSEKASTDGHSIHHLPRTRETSNRSLMSDLALDDPDEATSPHASSAQGASPNTDDILLAIEGILRRVRPSLLFQNLQIVASLVPSSVLDSSSRGKAFWDVALAALSIKRDLVEGEFGVVERALAALGEGTAEGRELAERLLLIGQ
ncbi:hypothetical protein RQP46_000946 [Phenoliferia psychrophenolica]